MEYKKQELALRDKFKEFFDTESGIIKNHSLFLSNEILDIIRKEKQKAITTEQAVSHLQKQLKKDKGLRLAWSSSIAMAYHDAEASYKRRRKEDSERPYADNLKRTLNSADRIIIADNAAELFLQQFCGEMIIR